MPLEPEFEALFTQTLSVKRNLGTNEYGQYAYEAVPVLIPCHIDGRVKEMHTPVGGTVLSTGAAYIDVTPWLTAEDSGYVPELSDATGERVVDIIGVQTRYDESGPHHMVVYFGEK